MSHLFITQVCVVYSLDVSTCLPLYEEEETIESLSAAEEEEEETSEAAATAAALEEQEEEEEEEEQWSGEEPEQEPPSELLERAEVIGEAQALPGLQAEVHTQAATAANQAPNGRAEEAGGRESPAEGVSILLMTCMFSLPHQKRRAKALRELFKGMLGEWLRYLLYLLMLQGNTGLMVTGFCGQGFVSVCHFLPFALLS